MASPYGSATIVYTPSKFNGEPAQDMIGCDRVSIVTNRAMENGHIGAAQDQVVAPLRAPLIAAADTPGIKSDATNLKWQVSTGTWVPGP